MLLTRDGESELIVAERSSAPLRQAAQAMHVALAAGGDAVRVDEGGGTLPDAPWFVREGAGLQPGPCAMDGVARACGIGFPAAVPAAAAYGDALGILASYARRSVLGYRELRRRADDWRGLVTQYEALFHSAPVLINAFDSDGRCTLWNEECERRFGWSIAEINRQDDPLALFYPDPSDRARVRESVDSAPCRAFREWHPLTRAGERLTVMWSNVSLPDGRIINIGLDATESRRAQEAIARMATVDSLTGCWNRRDPAAHEPEAERARLDPGAAFTALMLDLDFFKQVNDRYGHLAGDAALRHFCDQLRASCAAATPSDAWAARSSWCCWTAMIPARRWRSATGCARPCATMRWNSATIPDTVGQRRHCALRAGRHGHLGRDPARRPGAVPGQARGP